MYRVSQNKATIEFVDFGPFFGRFLPSDDSNTLQTPNKTLFHVLIIIPYQLKWPVKWQPWQKL